MLPWILCVILAAAIAGLAVKLYLLRRDIMEISAEFREHLSGDTNTPITTGSGDKYVKQLAAQLSDELKELRRQRKKYIDGDREITEAITNISHDLRTPLTAISGYLELMEKKEKSEELSLYLSYIQNRAETMKRLTEELFRYTIVHSEGELKLEPVNLRSVLEETVLSYYGALSERSIEPQINIADCVIIVSADKSALTRIFENILNNALKYSDGDLSIELKETGELTFSNSSAALSETETEKLFNRFYTVESARSSTGLGLSIAKTLSEKMNGELSASYADGKLSITLRLPVI